MTEITSQEDLLWPSRGATILNLSLTSRITIPCISWRWFLTSELSPFQSQPRPRIIPYGQAVWALNWQVILCSSTDWTGTLAVQPYARFQHGNNILLAKSSSAELRVSRICLKQMEHLVIRSLQLLQMLCLLPQDVMGGCMCCLQKEHTRKFRRPSPSSSILTSLESLRFSGRAEDSKKFNIVKVLFSIHKTLTKSVHKKHFFFYGSTALYGPGPLRFVEVSWSHTFRHTTVGRTPLDEWPARRNSQQTDIHVTGGIFFPCPGFFPFDPFFLYCLNPFVLHVTLRSILSSLRQTQHKHPCPRWDWNPRSQQANGRRPTP
jgi:hypothetical protein